MIGLGIYAMYCIEVAYTGSPEDVIQIQMSKNVKMSKFKYSHCLRALVSSYDLFQNN